MELITGINISSDAVDDTTTTTRNDRRSVSLQILRISLDPSPPKSTPKRKASDDDVSKSEQGTPCAKKRKQSGLRNPPRRVKALNTRRPRGRTLPLRTNAQAGEGDETHSRSSCSSSGFSDIPAKGVSARQFRGLNMNGGIWRKRLEEIEGFTPPAVRLPRMPSSLDFWPEMGKVIDGNIGKEQPIVVQSSLNAEELPLLRLDPRDRLNENKTACLLTCGHIACTDCPRSNV